MGNVEAKLSQTLSTSRIQNLGDGVFATAMTVMIFNFSVPVNFASENIGALFAGLWPEFFTFFLSMLVLGSFWVGHHNETHWVKHSDRTYLWINIVFLAFIVIIPFSTNLVSHHYYDSFAVMFYGVNLLICGFFLALHWFYATHKRRLVDPDLSDEIIRTMRFRALLPFIPGIGAILFALVSPLWALVLYGILFIPGAIPIVSDGVGDALTRFFKKPRTPA